MNCFCAMVSRRSVFNLISSQGYCQRFSPSQMSDTLRARFEPVLHMSSGFAEWSGAGVITTTPLNGLNNLTKNSPSDVMGILDMSLKIDIKTYLSIANIAN